MDTSPKKTAKRAKAAWDRGDAIFTLQLQAYVLLGGSALRDKNQKMLNEVMGIGWKLNGPASRGPLTETYTFVREAA